MPWFSHLKTKEKKLITITLLLLLSWIYQKLSTLFHMKYFSKCCKHFISDQNLNYQNEVKNILRKMVCGIKTIYCVRDFLPTKTRLLLLNAFVISHLHYSSILLNGISRSLISTMEKQLNWGIKACFIGYKMDSSHDPRLHYRISSVRHLLDLKGVLFFWKWKYNLWPAFSRLQIATANLKTHERTINLTYHSFAHSEQLKNSLSKIVVPLWNALPKN